MRQAVFLVIFATFVAWGGRASADFIVNGSFEQGPNPGSSYSTLGAGSTAITGWTVTSGTIDYIGGLWQASDGSRSLDMSGDGPGGIQQTFATTIGESYSVLFDLAGNNGAGPTVKHLQVSAAGSTQVYTFDTTGRSYASMGWTTMAFQFTATAATSTLAFLSLDNSAAGPALDNVRVTSTGGAVPEPASLVLLSVGCAGLGLVRRVRWRG